MFGEWLAVFGSLLVLLRLIEMGLSFLGWFAWGLQTGGLFIIGRCNWQRAVSLSFVYYAMESIERKAAEKEKGIFPANFIQLPLNFN